MAQTLSAATATAAAGTGSTMWSDNFLVDASAIAASAAVYIATDGSVANAASYIHAVNGSQMTIVANRQPKLNSLQYAGHGGGLDELPQSNGVGVTSQSVPASLYTALGEACSTTGLPTYISVILSTGATAASVGVEQR